MVEKGDGVSIDYELRLAADAERVVESGKNFKFVVGAGDVIKGMVHACAARKLDPLFPFFFCARARARARAETPNNAKHAHSARAPQDRGVSGMRKGEKRRIKVPWALGYGKRGSKPDIPAEADLVFTISLKSLSS